MEHNGIFLAKEIVVKGGSVKIDGSEFPWLITKDSITATHHPGGFTEVTLTIPCEQVKMEGPSPR